MSSKSRPWLYLIGTLFWTWGFYSIAFIISESIFEFPSILFYFIGGIGPLAVSSILVARGYWVRDNSVPKFLKNCLDPRKLSPRWYLFITVLILILAVLPLVFEPSKLLEKGVIESGPAIFLFIGAFMGGLEEIGWRGYAQESLQRKIPVVYTGLIIGLFWALWHLPLFFMEGTYQAQLGFGTMAFWSFNAIVIISSPIYAWVYNSAGKVTFAAVLYHALGNIVGEMTVDASAAPDIGVELIVSIILIITAWSWMSKKVNSDPNK